MGVRHELRGSVGQRRGCDGPASPFLREHDRREETKQRSASGEHRNPRSAGATRGGARGGGGDAGGGSDRACGFRSALWDGWLGPSGYSLQSFVEVRRWRRSAGGGWSGDESATQPARSRRFGRKPWIGSCRGRYDARVVSKAFRSARPPRAESNAEPSLRRGRVSGHLERLDAPVLGAAQRPRAADRLYPDSRGTGERDVDLVDDALEPSTILLAAGCSDRQLTATSTLAEQRGPADPSLLELPPARTGCRS